MNRSILIVICDFLLVSLLAFSTVDINKVADEGSQRNVRVDIVTNQLESGRDLTAVMKQALTEERKSRDLLLGELTKTREVATQREKQVETIQQALSARDQEAQKLQQQQAALQQQFAAAQTNIQTLSQQLQSKATEAVLTKEQLAALEAEKKKQAEQAAALQQQIAQLTKSNEVAAAERQRLAGQLQVAETEKRLAGEQVARMQEEVKVEREEKAKLAEGVKALASKSSELTKEIRENRPLAANTIFNEFVTNRVQARIDASRPGLLGTTRHRETQTVLATDGTNIFALCHVQDTPLTLWNPGTDWEQLSGTLSRNAAGFPIQSVSFYLRDPRVVLIPVSTNEARQLRCKVYRVSSDPYKFQDAVLVGAREGYYGECRFEIDLTTPEYVKLDNNFIKGLFGKFNPSRGDLVFSKQGELLGVMANATYCMMIRSFDAAAALRFGPDVREQQTGATLSILYSMVTGMPNKLQ
jgi:predicted  nucleic acid-binding Zn-ribbon protein